VARAGDAAALAGLAVSLAAKSRCGNRCWLAIKMLGDISIPLLLFTLGVRLTDSRHPTGSWPGRRGDCAAGVPAC
jgi:predicted permease